MVSDMFPFNLEQPTRHLLPKTCSENVSTILKIHSTFRIVLNFKLQNHKKMNSYTVQAFLKFLLKF